MKKTYCIFLACTFVLTCGKATDPVDGPVDNDPPIEKPEPKPEPPKDPDPKEVVLMDAFKEDFSSREPEYLGLDRCMERPDFRYFSAFPSLTEKGTKILLLRLDPADPEGEGAVVTSSDYVFYGSYCARIRIPDITRVQPKLGVVAELSLFDQDSVWGTDDLALGFRLADPKNLYFKFLHQDPGEGAQPLAEETVKTPSMGSFNASSQFYIYGLDWKSGEIAWWIKTSEKAEKSILATWTENVPAQPLRLQFRMYHSKSSPTKDNTAATQAPYYPFELELDWIQYTPSIP